MASPSAGGGGAAAGGAGVSFSVPSTAAGGGGGGGTGVTLASSGLTPAPTQYVRIISGDKHVYIVERRIAMVSGLIRTMLSNSAFKETGGELEFPEIPAATLEKVIEYFHYKAKYNNSKTPAPKFDIPTDLAVSVLSAAAYLDC